MLQIFCEPTGVIVRDSVQDDRDVFKPVLENVRKLQIIPIFAWKFRFEYKNVCFFFRKLDVIQY